MTIENEAKLLDQFLDALRLDSNAHPPAGLDAQTVMMARSLVRMEKRETIPGEDVAEQIWQKALQNAQAQVQQQKTTTVIPFNGSSSEPVEQPPKTKPTVRRDYRVVRRLIAAMITLVLAAVVLQNYRNQLNQIDIERLTITPVIEITPSEIPIEATNTDVPTETHTVTATNTGTPTATGTQTATSTRTVTPTATATFTGTASATPSRTFTATNTATSTNTLTPTASNTRRPTATLSGTRPTATLNSGISEEMTAAPTKTRTPFIPTLTPFIPDTPTEPPPPPNQEPVNPPVQPPVTPAPQIPTSTSTPSVPTNTFTPSATLGKN